MDAAQHRDTVCTSSSDGYSLVSAALLGAYNCQSVDHCPSSKSQIRQCNDLREGVSGFCV